MIHLYAPPSIRHFEPRRPVPLPAGAFASLEYDLVHALRPCLVADLGTGDGSAFFNICQSVRDHDIDAYCYAIDDWDARKGPNAPRFDDVNAYGRQHYLGITYFVRMAPVEAIQHFVEGTIDLLRIDVARPAVPLEQMDAWVSRLTRGGVVLFYGINSPQGQRFWEAAAGRGIAFKFRGVGILRRPGGESKSQLLRLLETPSEYDDLRKFYNHAAERYRMRLPPDLASVGAAAKPAK
jgi:hypothetical protein